MQHQLLLVSFNPSEKEDHYSMYGKDIFVAHFLLLFWFGLGFFVYFPSIFGKIDTNDYKIEFSCLLGS